MCSKLTIKELKLRQWRQWHSGAFIVNFWTYLTPFSSVFIVNFEQINVTWVAARKSLTIFAKYLHNRRYTGS